MNEDRHPGGGTPLQDPSSGDRPELVRYRQFVARRIEEGSHNLARNWLQRLESIVNEETRDVFPSDAYLDHIPSMIEQVGVILDSGDSELTMVSSIISHKALQLGHLRHEQKASISQLLREYDVLARLLGEFQIRWAEQYTGDVSVSEALEVSEVINAVIRLILQYTMDAFAERYMSTIEDQTQKLMSFNRFIGHEIRSPLNSALLGVELLNESGDLTELQTVDIDHIRQSLREAAGVVDNVECLMAIDKPTLRDDLVTQILPLGPLLSDLVQQLSETLAIKDVVVHLAADLGEVQLEAGRLKLLLSNLLSNAVKYSDPEKRARGVWVTRQDHADGSMELIVTDNGLGIPKNRLEDVLGLQVRAHATLDEAHSVSGNGLGLYLVDEAIRELGGSVEVKSELGEGTSVHLVFPTQAG